MGPPDLAGALVDIACGHIDVRGTAGDPGLFGPKSMVWRVHANPAVLAAGGIAAVILEMAEPRVRTGVWEHSSFRSDPLARMRRTAQATLLMTFGPSAAAVSRIETVNRMHTQVKGTTPQGETYEAGDPDLLGWVQATAAFGFLTAYRRLVQPTMSPADQDLYLLELAPLARRFGVERPPTTTAQLQATIEAMRPRLQPHPILDEALGLIAAASPVGPLGLPLQRLMLSAAMGLLPVWAKRQLRLPGPPELHAAAVAALSGLARLAPDVPAASVARQRALA